GNIPAPAQSGGQAFYLFRAFWACIPRLCEFRSPVACRFALDERYPPPACRMSELCEAHPPTPSHALTVQERIAYRHGRGRKIYSLIPKGADAPFVNRLLRTPRPSSLAAMTPSR